MSRPLNHEIIAIIRRFPKKFTLQEISDITGVSITTIHKYRRKKDNNS